MAQRNSEYARQSGDTYVTPRWVWDALYSVEPWACCAWECAPVNAPYDFLKLINLCNENIATNPPYGRLADKFIRHAIALTEPCNGKVAMLLPMNFDTAKSRHDLFRDCPAFKIKYALTKRIRWENLEQKEAGPSQNHAWFVWDHEHSGAASMGWLP